MITRYSASVLSRANPLFAIATIKLAELGEGTFDAELISWNVTVGDTIEKFDVLAEVQTDKATAEIPSKYSGTVTKLHHNIGDMAQVGKPFVDVDTQDPIDAKDSGQSSSKKTKTKKKKKTKKKNIPSPIIDSTKTKTSATHPQPDNWKGIPLPPGKILASPAARRIINSFGITLDMLQDIVPTGPNGIYRKTDVLHFENPDFKPISQSPQKVTPTVSPSLEPIREPVRGLKRTMIKTMTTSLEIPHFGLSDEINMNKLWDIREMEIKPMALDVKITFMPFFIKAISLALSEFPILNSSLILSPENIIEFYPFHNIGVAMDTPGGLLVPNIKNVQDISIIEIAREMTRLQELGKNGKLGAEDLTNTTFSLSNVGMIGGNWTKPVIAPPQVAIGALGAIERVPKFVSRDSNEVEGVRILPVSWSADHRIIDGATLARFNAKWKYYLENPSSMMIHMK